MARVARHHGLLPSAWNNNGEWRPITPDDIREARINLPDHDIVMEGITPGLEPVKAREDVQILGGRRRELVGRVNVGHSGQFQLPGTVTGANSTGPPV